MRTINQLKPQGKGLIVNAIAADGIIEGIEDQSKIFVLEFSGILEFMIKQSDKDLFKSFIKASKKER